MAGRYALPVLFLLCHRSAAQVNLCTTETGITVTECPSGTGPDLNTPGTGGGPGIMPPSRTEVEPCKDYTYTGTDKQIYMFPGSAPFTIKVKSHSITGSGINIGRFTCQYGGPPEKCHIYTIQSTVAASFSLYKQEGRLFGIHGHGSLTFLIDDGTCSIIPDGYNEIGETPYYLKLVKDKKTWEDARLACQADDPSGRTDLVNIDSKQKDDEVFNAIGRWTSWIGLKQKAGERWKYEWTRGGQVTAVYGQMYNDGTNGKGFQNWYSTESIDMARHDTEECVLYWAGERREQWNIMDGEWFILTVLSLIMML